MRGGISVATIGLPALSHSTLPCGSGPIAAITIAYVTVADIVYDAEMCGNRNASSNGVHRMQ